MVGQLSTNEYYVALERLGSCSKLSGRVTTALECTVVKEESFRLEGNPKGHQSVYVAKKRTNIRLLSIPMENCVGRQMKPMCIPFFVSSANKFLRNIWKPHAGYFVDCSRSGTHRPAASNKIASRTFRREAFSDCRWRTYLRRVLGSGAD